MSRLWLWLPLLLGWLPAWGLFTVLMMMAHQMALGDAALAAARLAFTAALLGLLVQRLTLRVPWPYPFRLRFLALHGLAALLYAAGWIMLDSLVESLLHGRWVIVRGPGIAAFLVTGVWFYVMVAGICYANRTAERGAQLQLQEARMQLAALRTQLQPHFLFNALHTVVQLIPLDPRAASRAAEQLAGLLRQAIEEQRDRVPLASEWAFVQRYLAIEALRFGERLALQADLPPEAMAGRLPSFALQTLVENAVRHAAAPSVSRTTLRIAARREAGALVITVEDDGQGMDLHTLDANPGTGLRRLRERLAWLYGGSAALQIDSAPGRGFRARLQLPQPLNDEDEDEDG